MNMVAEYLRATGCSQKELADLLATVDPRIDQALVSKMNTGVCMPSEAVSRYLCELMHCPSHANYDALGVNYRPPIETALKSEIYGSLIQALLGSSEERPYSRGYLANRLQVDDRTVRRMKEQALYDGVIIGSSSHSKGYYLCFNRDQLARVRAETWARVSSLLKGLRAIDRELAKVPGQIRMDEDGQNNLHQT